MSIDDNSSRWDRQFRLHGAARRRDRHRTRRCLQPATAAISPARPLTEILIGDGDGDTFDGGGGVDIILAGGGNDTIVADQTDYVIDGGGGTDTLQVGANFTSSSDAQIVGIENVTLTAADLTLNLSNQTENFKITGSSGIDVITAGCGSDTITAGWRRTTTLTGGGGATNSGVATNTGNADHRSAGYSTGTTRRQDQDFAGRITARANSSVDSVTLGDGTGWQTPPWRTRAFAVARTCVTGRASIRPRYWHGATSMSHRTLDQSLRRGGRRQIPPSQTTCVTIRSGVQVTAAVNHLRAVFNRRRAPERSGSTPTGRSRTSAKIATWTT